MFLLKIRIQTDAPWGAATATLQEKPSTTPFFICSSVGRVIHVVNYMFSCFCSIKHDVVRYDFRVIFGSSALLLFCRMLML